MAKHTLKHDTFLRTIMSNPQIALDYFRACIPQNVLDMLDFSTLQQLPDTCVRKNFKYPYRTLCTLAGKQEAKEK